MTTTDKKVRILCVEDDAQMRTFLQAQLKARNFQVQTVRDGAQAIDMAAIFQPQLALTTTSPNPLASMNCWPVCVWLYAVPMKQPVYAVPSPAAIHNAPTIVAAVKMACWSIMPTAWCVRVDTRFT